MTNPGQLIHIFTTTGERGSATVGGKSSHFVDLDLGGRKGKVLLPRTRSAEDGLHELSDLQTRL